MDLMNFCDICATVMLQFFWQSASKQDLADIPLGIKHAEYHLKGKSSNPLDGEFPLGSMCTVKTGISFAQA